MADGLHRVNFLMHVDLVVESCDRSIAFYAEHLGATVMDDIVYRGPLTEFYARGVPAEALRLVFIKLPAGRSQIGQMIELIEIVPRPTTKVARAPTWFTIAVEDFDEMLKELESKGVKIQLPPCPVSLPKLGSSRLTFIEDPDGNMIELMEPS